MRVFIFAGYICLGLCVIHHNADAQILLSGTVVNADDGQPLFTANIRVKDAFFTTISNEEGAFLLKVSELPVTLIITHIGYADQEILVNESAEPLAIKMQPIAYPFEEIVVTPGMGSAVMQKVIVQKRQWRPKLKRFKTMAYTRQIVENTEKEPRIVGMGDLVSEIHWDHAKGSREIILSKRHTKNIPEWLHTYSIVKPLKSLPNIYDNEIAFSGNRIIGPTHPDALDFYHFQVLGREYNGKQIIYEISVEPKTKLLPAFTGRVFVLDEAFAILRAELNPSPIGLAVAPFAKVQVSFLQHFQEFGDQVQVWLPIDFHMQIEGRVVIPLLVRTALGKITVITQLKNFEVNKAYSTQLYKKNQIVTVREDSLVAKFPDRMPFSKREEKAYREIDEKLTLRKAFPPSGPMARWTKMRLGSGPSQPAKRPQRPKAWQPNFRLRINPGGYNRVSMTRANMIVRLEMLNRSMGRRYGLDLGGEYAQGLSRWPYLVGFGYKWGRAIRTSGDLRIYHQAALAERYRSHHYGAGNLRRLAYFGSDWRSGISDDIFYHSALALLGWEDYFKHS